MLSGLPLVSLKEGLTKRGVVGERKRNVTVKAIMVKLLRAGI